MSKSFVESIGEKYLNQLVDVFLGDVKGLNFYAEEERYKLSFLRGTITGYEGDMLIITCQISTDVKVHTFEVAINSYNIKAVMPVTAGMNTNFNVTRLLLDNESTQIAQAIKGSNI